MNKIIYLLLICSSNSLIAQNTIKKSYFNYEITKVKADLNKDGIFDFVIVTQDTLNDEAPYLLQIYFGDTNGDPQLITTTTKAIDPQFPNGKDGYQNGSKFLDITIKNGVISINNELLRGHFEHKFRFQNGNFELIGCTSVYSDGLGTITSSDFNLSTGLRTLLKERYDTDKVLSKTKEKILIRPLPKLQDFVVFEKSSIEFNCIPVIE